MIAAAHCARNAGLSPDSLRPSAIDAATATTNRIANSQRRMLSEGSIAGWMMKCPYADTTANSTKTATPSGMRSFAARERSLDPISALSATQAAPAAKNIAKPSKPVSSVNGVTRPSKGMPE